MSSPDVIAQARVNGGSDTWRGYGFEVIERVNTGGPGLYRLYLVERDFTLEMPVAVNVEGFGDLGATFSLVTVGTRDALLVRTFSGAVSQIENFSVTVWDNLDSDNGTITVLP